MGSARKYLALALAACQTKHYEEAGVFLAQAAHEEDAADLAKELGAEEAVELENSDGVATSSESCDESDAGGEPAEDDEWEEEGEDEESISSVTRRKTTTMFHIGKIMAAAMDASSADDGDDDGDDEDSESSEADPDFPGEALVPASFSSVKVKSIAVKSPIKMKDGE